MPQFRIRIVQLPRWQLVLAAAVLVALLATLFVLAIGVFLILLPIILVASAIAWLFGGSHVPAPGRGKGPIIDGEYRVIDRKEVGKDRDD